MSRFRDIKRQARRDLHNELLVAALYIPVPSATPVPCTVRVWRKREDPQIAGISQQGGASMVEVEDRIRFYLPDVILLRRNGVVSVEEGEAYRIDHTYPVDDEFQTARVIPLTEAEATGLPVPA